MWRDDDEQSSTTKHHDFLIQFNVIHCFFIIIKSLIYTNYITCNNNHIEYSYERGKKNTKGGMNAHTHTHRQRIWGASQELGI